MRPIPIEKELLVRESMRREVIAGPGDLFDSHVAPVEAIVEPYPRGGVTLSVRMRLEDDDLAKLQAGANVWITFWGHMVPFSCDVGP